MATFCSLTSKQSFPFYSCILYISMTTFLELFLSWIALFPCFWKCAVYVLYFRSSKGKFRQWETQLHQNPGPCRCLHSVHAHHHLETDSSSPRLQIPDHCWLTDLDLSFSSCLGLGSGQNLHRLVKGSWMEMISYSHCNPGECWLCCCLR